MSYFQVKNLTKKYGETVIFNQLSFNVDEGELITLLGPSGCGKSTLLRSVAGLIETEGGEMVVDGVDISRLSPKERNISMVFQSYALFPNMTVKENIAFGLKMKKMDKKQIEEKVREYIALVDLEGKENDYPRQLSGGQQQRVALARALVVEPKILLLDEPLSALDAKIRKNLRLQIRKIQKDLNITTIFVTHDQEEALILSDRIFLMDKGMFSQIGTPEEIYTAPQNEFVAGFMGNYNILKKEDLQHMIKDINGKPDGHLFAVRPEVIKMRIDLSGYDNTTERYFSGKITDIIVLGSILRFHIEAEGITVTVDVLNNDENRSFMKNQSAYLLIPIEEFKKLA